MRNKQYGYSQEYINRWVIPYADFITLLLALFIVLYSLSQMNANHVKTFSSSVGKVFDAKNKSIKAEKINEIDVLKYKRKLLKIFSTTETDVISSNVDISSQIKPTDDLKKEIKNINVQLDKEAVEFKNIGTLVSSKLKDVKGVSISRESRGLIIRLNDTVLFTPGSDIIKGKARLTLDRLAGILKDIPNSIRIEGHTDNQPIGTQRFPSNWELSTFRATNIIKYLVDNHKFNPSRLSAVGYGEYMPLKNNSSPEGRSLNRRVDIVILSTSSKIFEPKAIKLE